MRIVLTVIELSSRTLSKVVDCVMNLGQGFENQGKVNTLKWNRLFYISIEPVLQWTLKRN